MQWYAVLLVTGLFVSVTSVRVDFLNSDGATASEFNEGDTAIIRCRVEDTNALYTSAKLEWQPHGSDERLTVAEGEQIIDQPGDGDRFSGANLTDIGGTMDYRVTITGVDRYDNGFGLRCQFITESGDSTGTGGVASNLVVNWQPPSVHCSDIADKVENGQDVSYSCSVTDADAKSNGSLSLSINEEKQGAATAAGSPADPVGTRYTVSYTIKITEDAAKAEYMCRYHGIGGYEEYNSNCTFKAPSCLVQSLADPCPANDVVSAHGHIHIMAIVSLPLLMILWVV